MVNNHLVGKVEVIYNPNFNQKTLFAWVSVAGDLGLRLKGETMIVWGVG